jgi:hypothetical protein
MGWSYGYDKNWQRDIGYGVPATCDHPGCGKEIDRGLAHVCAGEHPRGGEHGCGLYFCGDHLQHHRKKSFCCARCYAGRRPYKPTPDTGKWIAHKLTDESWLEWREQHPETVAQLQHDILFLLPVLSVCQPWATALVKLGKDIENRKRRSHYRGPFLIHASLTQKKKIDQLNLERIGDIINLEVKAKDFSVLNTLPRGGIIGIAEINGCVKSSESPWFFGPWGWQIANAHPLPFHPCKGQLGFFRL